MHKLPDRGNGKYGIEVVYKPDGVYKQGRSEKIWYETEEQRDSRLKYFKSNSGLKSVKKLKR